MIAAAVLGLSLLLLPLALIALPWTITQRVLIPLGLPRAAYYAAAVSPPWRADALGGAALAAAWALCRARRPAPGTEAWIEEKLAGRGVVAIPGADGHAPLRGAGIAAAAMLAAHRGDLEGARALFESLATLDDRACPREARRIAAGWLAAEAAARGDWAATRAAAEEGGGRALRLLDAIAARLLDDAAAPSVEQLWLRWILAPRRRAMLPLVRRALAARPGAPRPLPDEPAPRAASVPDGDLLGRAVLLHATLLLRREKGISSDELRRLGGAWDAALEDERGLAELRERARLVGASGPEAALGPLQRAVEEDVAALARASRASHEAWDELGATIRRANRRLRDDLLSEVELACDALRRRVDERRALAPLDEWREWTSLRAHYERAAALVGWTFRRLAFPKVHMDVCHAAVWLFNERKERALGNAMIRWLLAEAEALGDTRAAELQRKNAACGV